MFKKCCLLLLFLLSAGVPQVQANPKKEITMLVAPPNALVLQIAQDLSRRYPILLVSYVQTGSNLKLTAWTGKHWVAISPEDYINGAFFENPPQHTILIDTAEKPAPDVLIPDGTWCVSGNRLRSVEPHVMLHLLGNFFDFPYLTWKQFSRRYHEPVGRINPSLLNMSWWNTYGEDLWGKRDLLNPEADMDKWLYLNITPPLPVEPVVLEETPEPVPPAEIPAALPDSPAPESLTVPEAALDAETPPVDPFSSEEIPAAEVILTP